MIRIEQPEDFMGLALYNILNYRKDDVEFICLVKNWNKSITFEIEQLYSITVIFENDIIKFKTGDVNKTNLKIKTDLTILMNIVFGKSRPIKFVLKKKIKIKGRK